MLIAFSLPHRYKSSSITGKKVGLAEGDLRQASRYGSVHDL